MIRELFAGELLRVRDGLQRGVGLEMKRSGTLGRGTVGLQLRGNRRDGFAGARFSRPIVPPLVDGERHEHAEDNQRAFHEHARQP